MTTIDKYIDAAGSNWDLAEISGRAAFTRVGGVAGDGYPLRVAVDYDPSTLEATGGSVLTGYNPEADLEEFELGTRSLMNVITEIDNPFRYKVFLDAWIASDPASLSEKLLAGRIKESERQIRNARIMGSMNGYLADKLCCVALGKHPIEMYGFEAWVEYESRGAWPERSKRAKEPEVTNEPPVERAPEMAALPGGWR